MSLTNILTDYDTPNSRVDVRWIPFIGIVTAGLIARLLMDNGTGMHVVQLLLAVLGVATATAGSLLRMGSSKLSTAIITALAVVLTGSLGVTQVADLVVFGLLAWGCLEYFALPTKGMAVILGAVLAVVAAGLGDKGVLLVSLLVVSVWARAVWHVVVERLTKKRLALFIIKTWIITAVSVGVFVILDGRYAFPWADAPFITSVDIHWALLFVIGLLTLRGLWATLLLRTVRSPKYRALRIFFVVFGGGVLVSLLFIHVLGDNIFLPNVVQWLGRHGLTEVSAESLIFLVYGVLLLASAGIDRWLFKDTMEARQFRIAESEALALAERRQ